MGVGQEKEEVRLRGPEGRAEGFEAQRDMRGEKGKAVMVGERGYNKSQNKSCARIETMRVHPVLSHHVTEGDSRCFRSNASGGADGSKLAETLFCSRVLPESVGSRRGHRLNLWI